MEKLIELHDAVKNHPYRTNKQDEYRKTYKELLGELSHEFYMTVKETKYKASGDMVHDFNMWMSYLGRPEYDDEATIHTERCIGTIHEFISTGKVESFWNHYFGKSKIGLPREKKYIWIEDKNKYYFFCKEKDLDSAIEILEEKCKDEESSKWYGNTLEWIKELKEYWYGNK